MVVRKNDNLIVAQRPEAFMHALLRQISFKTISVFYMTQYTEPPWQNNIITHHPNKGLNPKRYQYITSLLNTFAAYKFIQHGMNYKGLVLKLKLQPF